MDVFHVHNFDVSRQNDTATDHQLPRPRSKTIGIPLTNDVIVEFKAWQHNDIVEGLHNQPKSQYPNAFVFKILIQDIVRHIYHSREDSSIQHTENYVVGGHDVDQTFWESDAQFESTIGRIFSHTGPLFQYLISIVAPYLSSFARSVPALTCKDCGVTVRPFVIAVKWVSLEFHYATRFLPATKSSVDALEKVKVEGSGSVEQCMICLEELPVGVEVTRMPCSHVYHGDCIVGWLETSHSCPLCRFAMPY